VSKFTLFAATGNGVTRGKDGAAGDDVPVDPLPLPPPPVFGPLPEGDLPGAVALAIAVAVATF